jgi:hypothetical protein
MIIQRAKFDTDSIRFQPSEAEAITGVSTVLLRDWRRRGILAQHNNGKAGGFSIGALAEIALLNALSVHGIGPKTVHGWSFSMVGSIVSFALAAPEAWDTAEDFSAWQRETSSNRPRRYTVITGLGVRNTDQPMSLPMGDDESVLTVVDLQHIGDAIRHKAGRPLARVSGYLQLNIGD